MRVRLAVDAMGGDHGLPVTVDASCAFLERNPQASVLLVGASDLTRAALDERLARSAGRGRRAGVTSSDVAARIRIVPASQVIGMDDPPATVLRCKRDASMRIALEQVRDGEADACVSAGNTGALMVLSRAVLKMLQGIERPAIAAQLPNQRGRYTTVLDLGANVDCSPEILAQFAVMGSALVSVIDGVESPRLGLLNIGEEAIKGNEVVKEAGELIRQSNLNFHGNVEGNDIYKGTVDVVVCDGFVGNVALKTSEGLAQMLGTFIREEFGRGVLSRAAAIAAWPVLRRLKRRMDHRRYNGAGLMGLRGVVVKSHGASDAFAFGTALERAAQLASNGLTRRIESALAQRAMVAPVRSLRSSGPVTPASAPSSARTHQTG